MPGTQLPTFADANSSFDDARFVILGVPFDRTTSFRPGARFGPDGIRQQSWNFESYNFETDLDLAEVAIHDLGNAPEFGSAEEMAEGVRTLVEPVWRAGKFPLTLGGDHSCAVPVLEAALPDAGLGVLYLDAHLDFRDSYLNDRRSHACSARRMADLLGPERIVHVGVRSMSRDEKIDNDRLKMRFFPSSEIRRVGIEDVTRRALEALGTERIYLTLDIDVIDPAFAPATGTPEPFGVSGADVKSLIGLAADRLVGMDIMEVAPPWDQGNTAGVAARLAREAILRVEQSRRANSDKSTRAGPRSAGSVRTRSRARHAKRRA